MFFKIAHVCKLWFKKLTVYSLCALLLNQQLFYLSASIKQISVELGQDDSILRVRVDHHHPLDRQQRSTTYGFEVLEASKNLSLFPQKNRASYEHRFGGFIETAITDQGLDFKIFDGQGERFFLTWHKDKLKIHAPKTTEVPSYDIRFNGTVELESSDQYGQINLSSTNALFNGKIGVNVLNLKTHHLLNYGELTVFERATIQTEKLDQLETNTLKAKNLFLSVDNLRNEGEIGASNLLVLDKGGGEHKNTGLIGSAGIAFLDFSAMRSVIDLYKPNRNIELGRLAGNYIFIRPPGHPNDGSQYYITKSLIEAKEYLHILDAKPLNDLLSIVSPDQLEQPGALIKALESLGYLDKKPGKLFIENSQIITPYMYTTANEISVEKGLENVGRLRVLLHPIRPDMAGENAHRNYFRLGENFTLGGVLEFAEPGVPHNLAQAKERYDALYAPIKTPDAHSNAYDYEISLEPPSDNKTAILKAEGLRVFGQKTAITIGNESHNMSGLIDLRQGDGEIDIYTKHFDLKQGHILAKEGAIRAPNTLKIGRLKSEGNVFSTFYTSPNSESPEGRQFFDDLRVHENAFQISRGSSLEVLGRLKILGPLVHESILKAEDLELWLTDTSYVTAGTILSKKIQIGFNKLISSPKIIRDRVSSYELDFFAFNLYTSLLGIIRFLNYINNRHEEEKEFVVSGPSTIRCEEFSTIEGGSLENKASIFHAQMTPQPVDINSVDVTTVLYQTNAPIQGRLPGYPSFSNPVCYSPNAEPMPYSSEICRRYTHRCMGYSIAEFLRKNPGSFASVNDDLSNFYKPRAILLGMMEELGIGQNFFPAQTSFGGDVVLDHPRLLEGFISASEALVKVGLEGLILGSKNPFLLRSKSPLVESTTWDALKGFVTLNPLVDAQLRKNMSFIFLTQDTWFDQDQASSFYQSLKDQLVIRAPDGQFSRHQGSALFLMPPSRLIEWVQEAVQKRLMRGNIEDNQSINKELVQELHRQASTYYDEYLQCVKEVSETSLATVINQSSSDEKTKPFLFYSPKLVNTHVVLAPTLFIPSYLINEVHQNAGTMVGKRFVAAPARTFENGSGPALSASGEEKGHPQAIVPAQGEYDKSGPIVIRSPINSEGPILIISDGNIDIQDNLKGREILILSLEKNVNLKALFERKLTPSGFEEELKSQPKLKALGDIIVSSPNGDTTLSAALIDANGRVVIQGRNIDIKAQLLEAYKVYYNSRHRSVRPELSHIKGGLKVYLNALGILRFAGADIEAGEEGAYLEGGQVQLNGTSESARTDSS